MAINFNIVNIIFSVCFFLLTNMAYSQSENFVNYEMYRYSVKCELKYELDIILESLKPEDQKLVFIINTYAKDKYCQISLTTSYSVNNNDHWLGFFRYKDKLFLLEHINCNPFFTKVNQETIKIKTEINSNPNKIIEPHIDNLPYWLIEYSNGKFLTELSSY